jgi:predicted transcriptional regulator
MPNERAFRLGELQLKILKVLWSAGPLAVAEIHTQLGADQFAYTTIATMLRKMEGRGLVRHREQQRRFIYEAAVTEDAVSRNTTDDLVQRLFDGNLMAAVSHLLETRDVSPEELDRLERLIQERKRRQ